MLPPLAESQVFQHPRSNPCGAIAEVLATAKDGFHMENGGFHMGENGNIWKMAGFTWEKVETYGKWWLSHGKKWKHMENGGFHREKIETYGKWRVSHGKKWKHMENGGFHMGKNENIWKMAGFTWLNHGHASPRIQKSSKSSNWDIKLVLWGLPKMKLPRTALTSA